MSFVSSSSCDRRGTIYDVQGSERFHRGARQGARAGAHHGAGQPGPGDLRASPTACRSRPAAARRCCSRSQPASTCRSRINLFGSMKRMCMALGVREARRSRGGDRRARHAEDARRHDRRVEDAADAEPAARPDAEDGQRRAVPGSGQEGRLARRAPDPASAGRRTAAATSRCRWSSRRIPETGARNIGTYRMQVFDGRTTGHALAAAQRRRAALSRRRAARPAPAGRGRARAGSGAGVFGDGADARRARRADARGLPAPRARRARQVRDGRSRGAGQRADRPRGLRRAWRAAARRAVRRSHRLLLASGRLSGLPPDLHHAAQATRST